jgi:hypothetical protein
MRLLIADRIRRPELDGAASVLIGGILTSVAVLIARKSRGLPAGESIDSARYGDSLHEETVGGGGDGRRRRSN